MDRKLPTAKAFLLFCLGLFLTISFNSIGQQFTYTSGALSVDITLVHPCSGNNGVMFFTVNSVDPSQTEASLVVLGPASVFPQVNIAPGNTYTFNASQSLPVGIYDWIIGDNVTTIGSLTPDNHPELVLQDISAPALSITKDIETNNPSCITPSGQIQGTIVGGSQTIGIGSYQYKWTADNGSIPVAGLTGATDGATPLNLATLLGVGGLRGGTYTLEVSDDFSRCDVTQTFTITDPSPAVQTITNQSPPAQSICTGDLITVILSGSEAGVTYEILRNGSSLPTPITFIGTGAAPFIMTFPHTQFVSGNSILVQATNGFCTTVPMSGNINLVINPLPTITGLAAVPVCQGGTSTGLSYTSTTGSPSDYSIDYDAFAELQGFIDIVNAALPASPISIAVPGAATPGIYNASVTVRNSTTTCISTPIPITVTIIANPTITLGANPSVCLGATTASLGYSATTGTPNQYSINFDGLAEAQGFVDVTNIALPATPISINIPGSAGVGSYNGTLTVRNSITGCISSLSQAIAVTINSNPTITLGPNPTVCSGILTVDLGYTATTSSPTQFSIDFNGAAEAQGFVDVSNAPLPASPIVINVPAAPTPGVYVGSITVTNPTTGCVSAPQAISITVIASPTITLGPNPSVCIGSSLANLGYTGTTNSPNQYSINFDLIAEGQGFVDIVNVVLPASPIVINIPGAAVAGTYNATLTVTNTITGCTSSSQPITVTIEPLPTITLGTNPSVCTGTLSAPLGFTATTGSPDQYSIDFNGAAELQGFVDVVNAALPATPISITVPGAAAAGLYSATITVRNSTTGCISVSSPISVTIEPTPTITLGANPSVCVGTLTANLGFTATTGTPDQYSINFDLAAEAQGFIDVVNAVLPATPIIITVPGAALAGTYNATITVLNTGTGCISAPQAITVTIIANPTITLGPNPSVCIGTTTANLGYTGTTGSPNQYNIDFDVAAQGQGFVDIVNAALPATPIVINVPGIAVAGTYNGILTVVNTLTGCTGSTQPITVTINPTPTISLGPNPSICSGSLSALLGYTATTGSPDQYSIDFNAAAELQGFVDVVNAALPVTPITITVPGAALAGTYTATVTVRNSTTGCVSVSSPISVTVETTPTITLGTNPSVCIGTLTANLTYTATTGTPNQYSIDFNAAAEAQGFVDVVNAVLPATPIVVTIPGIAVAGTYNATISVVNTGTGCLSTPQAISVTIVDNPTITIAPNPSVCIGSATANLAYTGTTGSPNQYTIDFDGAAQAQGFVDIVNAALPASPIVINIPGAAVIGTYNATITVLNTTTGCASPAQAITVTIDPTPTITLGPSPSVCVGSTSANLGFTATTGAPDQYSIDFNVAAEAQGFVDVVNAVLPATPIIITVPIGAIAGIYSANLTVLNSGTGCTNTPQAITVTVVANPAITLGPDPSVCIGSTSANLGYTGTTGTPDQYSINFDAAAETAGFVDVVNAALPATPIVITIPGTAIAGIYNGTLTVINSVTGCISSSQAITVTIEPIPTITLGPNPSICSGTLTASLGYLSTTGSPDQYSIDFNAAAEAQGFVDVVNAALPTTPILITVPGAAVANTYTASISVRNSTTGCVSVNSPISITIDQVPTITLGANPTICSGLISASLPYTATTGSPDQYSIDFNAAAEAQGFVDVVNAPLPATPIAITVPAGAVAATYSATLTVRTSASGCASTPAPISITITPSPTATITGTTTICSGSSTNLTVTFTGSTPWTFRYSDGTTTSAPIVSAFNTFSIPTGALSATTTYTIVDVSDATVCTGIVTGSSAVVTVSQPPATNLAVGVTLDPLCSGGISDVTIAASQLGVSYQLRNDAGDVLVGAPVVGTGATINIPTGVLLATTTFNVLATSTGCPPVELTNLSTVNVSGAINAGLSVTAASSALCTGNSTNIQIAASENGVLYQLRNDSDNSTVGVAVPGNGGLIDLPTGILTATTTFNVLATNGACSIELTDVETVTVSPAPSAALVVAVTLDPLCVGGATTVTVALSEVGISYQLRNDADDSPVGPAVVGTGATISLPSGVLNTTTTFNVLATGTGCPPVELTTLALVTVSGVIDASLTLVAAASPICQGTSTDIQIANSVVGVDYQLRDDATDNAVGIPVAGTGATILLPTGNLTTTTTFNVLATNGACSIELVDLETVNVDIAPNPALVVNVSLNPLCIGGTSAVTISLSQLGVSYQLRNDADDSPIGSAVIGTGGTISLPTGILNATTTFNILATSGICPAVQLATTPTVTVAGTLDASLAVNSSASPICAGTSTFIQVVASESGVNYQLRNDLDDSPVGSPIVGTGGTINLPTGNLSINTTFNVVASNGTCSIELTDTETITMSPSPAINLSVTPGSALICSGASSNIIVAGSELGVSYQLRNNVGNVLVGSAVVGTGGNILLPTGNLAVNTTFNVLATVGTCSAQLTATVTVTIRPLGDPACGGGGPSDCTNFSSIQPIIITQPSCNDRDAGEVSFTIARTDGTPTTFRVLWTINGTTQTKFTSGTTNFDDLSSGLYQYTIIDEGNGKSCGPVDFFLDLKTQVEILTKQVTADVSCFGGTDGNAILSVDGTTTGEYWYKYVLDGVESGAQTFTPGAPLPGGLPADDNDFIIIKVDDNFAFTCPDTVMVRIKHTFPRIDFTVAATDVTTCNGTDGAIQVGSIAGGNSGSSPLQIRLKKAVSFSVDPSGYTVLFDFEDVAAGFKEYDDLAQGNYVVDVRDEQDCIQSKPIAVQAPGQVPLSSVTIVPTDATCTNEGNSGSVRVIISDAGVFQVAISQDQINVPDDDEFVNYNSPSLPSITFNNLSSGVYYLYFKSNTTTCPTRTDAVAIGGVQAISDFEVLSSCDNVNLTLNNITGQEDAPFVIRVFRNSDKFFKIDSLTASSIPLSRSVSFIYNPPLQHTFLATEGTYRFVMVQTQTTGAGTCTLVSDTIVYDVRQGLGIVLGQIKPSFPEPKRTGSIEIENIDGGTRFISGANELYYEISLSTADDDIVIFDWSQVKLNPQNKFSKIYEFLPPGVYRVKVRDATGCIKTQDVEIPLDQSVFVPNIFSPNDDNINDTFEVLNLPLTGTHRLIISNRWGNEVFKSNDYRDGNFWNANEVADGIYFYRLQVEGGEVYTGWVEILRGAKP